MSRKPGAAARARVPATNPGEETMLKYLAALALTVLLPAAAGHGAEQATADEDHFSFSDGDPYGEGRGRGAARDLSLEED